MLLPGLYYQLRQGSRCRRKRCAGAGSRSGDQSVGYGGLPDRDGKVTLDACIMDEKGNCGAVMFLEGIKHPIKIARLVMDKTPHVQLVGEGALQFAIANGFTMKNCYTSKPKRHGKTGLKMPNMTL
jgi:N4-(beta-N-acetylglucosaminyl)-L-asparaginase